MTSLLESYEQQYSTLTADITHLIGKISISHGVEKQGHVRQVEKLFEEAAELLEQMDLEVKEQPGKDRQKYQTRVRSYKTELSKLQTDVRRAKLGLDNREDLLGDDSHDAEDQRTRLLENSERLERVGRKLDHGYRTAIETEQLGTTVLENLHTQRQTIQRSRSREQDTMSEKISLQSIDVGFKDIALAIRNKIQCTKRRYEQCSREEFQSFDWYDEKTDRSDLAKQIDEFSSDDDSDFSSRPSACTVDGNTYCGPIDDQDDHDDSGSEDEIDDSDYNPDSISRHSRSRSPVIIQNRILLVVIGLIMVLTICVTIYLIVRRS